ncbi:MAG: HNH endonuclease [Actinomycetota bacterium]|nr:HNH endonuclease [Actinomycetota bacterium]
MYQGVGVDTLAGPAGGGDAAGGGARSLDPIEVALAAVDQGLDLLDDLDVTAPDAIGLMQLAQLVERRANRMFLTTVRLAGEIDTRGLHSDFDAPSTRILMRDLLGVAPADTAARILLAETTCTRITPTGSRLEPLLSQLAATLPNGRIGPGHAAVITRTMDKLPPHLDEDVRFECERILVAQAQQLDPPTLERLARGMLAAADPDGTEPDSGNRSKMELHIGRRRDDGLTKIWGLLDDLTIEMLCATISPLAAPMPSGSIESSPETLATSSEPNGQRSSDVAVDNPHLDDQALRDDRPPATRRAHALGEVLDRYLRVGAGPRNGGERPHLTVTIDYRDLVDSVGRARLDYTGELSAAAARMLACDAKILPIVLGGDSQILDVGRQQYAFPRHVRRAISQRDGGCAWPGCDRPSPWCDAHHIRWWARDLGVTSVDNGCLLCPHHHQQIHQQQWSVKLAEDGLPEFVPPVWIDPLQQPRRNLMHRPLVTQRRRQ